MTLSPEALRDDIARGFGIGADPSPPSLGLEVEAIPVDNVTGRAVRIVRTLVALESLDWARVFNAKSGMTELHRPDGARVTFEPGGQLEYSTSPHSNGSALLANVDDAIEEIGHALSAHGISLRMTGLDPITPIDQVPLQLDGPRYRRMDAYFASLGPSGRRMMRQTAAIQLSVDLGAAPLERWRLLGALAPVVGASFANSPLDTGRRTGERSIRRRVWAELDPARTGLRALGADPVGEYLEFALRAPAFLMGQDPARAEPFANWLSRGATRDDWQTHLSTLFPDVRPRGYFEFRVADAVGGDAIAALVALVAGLAWHPECTGAALDALPTPNADLMARAGRDGLSDPDLARAAAAAVELALRGCRALGPALLSSADLTRATRYFDRYTAVGRCPADFMVASSDTISELV
ncbi:MAG TPA: glutamate-cysteine ligase family protein [Gemmatimonadaceae bacterium]